MFAFCCEFQISSPNNDGIHARLFIHSSKHEESHTMRKKFRHIFGTIVCPQWVAVNFPPIFFFFYCVGCQVVGGENSSEKAFFYHFEFCFAYVIRRQWERVGKNWINFISVSCSLRNIFQQLVGFPLWNCREMKMKSVNVNGSFSIFFVLLRFQFQTEICSLSSTSWIYTSF